jgi:NitT/TauT family transport system substrate-binding protein
MTSLQSRREFAMTLSLAGAIGLLGTGPALADEPPPERSTITLLKDPTCGAPISISEELMLAEGFTDVRFVDFAPDKTDAEMIASGWLDIGVTFAVDVLRQLDAGAPITVLAGVHPGCVELFAHDPIRDIRELKGKRIAAWETQYSGRMLLTLMAANVGLNAAADIEWVTSPMGDAAKIFEAGGTDALLAIPPMAQDLATRRIGRVILSTATDRPWSQYFCCMLTTSNNYLRQHPIATKRAMRAILKSTDICASDPAWAAQRMVDDGFAPRYDEALQLLSSLPYGKWREYDPEDTLRFYALLLREVAFIKSSPQQIIAEGSNWRLLQEIKRELKA